MIMLMQVQKSSISLTLSSNKEMLPLQATQFYVKTTLAIVNLETIHQL